MGAVLLPSEMHCEVLKTAELEGKGGLALPVAETWLNKLSIYAAVGAESCARQSRQQV